VVDRDARRRKDDLTFGHLRTHAREWCGTDGRFSPRLGCLGPWCDAHVAPKHGRVQPSSIVLVNNTVQVICDEFYEITGTGTPERAGTRYGESVCMPDGYFDPVLTCDGPWCDALAPPPHAFSVPTTRVRVGERVNVLCKYGYSHWGAGSQQPLCQHNRSFQAAQWCYPNCGAHPDVAHATVWPERHRLHIGAGPHSNFEVAGGGAWPQDVRITCDEHYAAIGPGSDKPWCQANGSFSPHISCRRVCDPFQAPAHSLARLGPIDPYPHSQGWLEQFGIDDAPLQGWGLASIPFLEGEHARMLCNAGFLAVGAGVITPVCQANGNFSQAKSCVRTCKRFETPAHASVSFVTSGPNGSALVGDWAFMVCDTNFTLSGNGTHKPTCQDNGRFEARRMCVPVVLPPPKPSLKKAGQEITKIAQVVRQAQESRDRIKLGALEVGKLAQLAAFTYEEAETKLPCRLGFETYCHERIREAKRAQRAARIAADNATTAIEEANARLRLLHRAQQAIVDKYQTVRHVQVCVYRALPLHMYTAASLGSQLALMRGTITTILLSSVHDEASRGDAGILTCAYVDVCMCRADWLTDSISAWTLCSLLSPL